LTNTRKGIRRKKREEEAQWKGERRIKKKGGGKSIDVTSSPPPPFLIFNTIYISDRSNCVRRVKKGKKRPMEEERKKDGNGHNRRYDH